MALQLTSVVEGLKMRFETLVERLNTSTAVDGLMPIGSSAQGTLNEHSDRDLLIVLNDRPIAITGGAIFCEGVLVDLIIEMRDRIEELAATESGSISLSDYGAPFFNWFSSGCIVFDKRGCLGRLRDRLMRDEIGPVLTEGKSLSLVDKALYNLAQTRRMSQSSDSVYQQAVDLRMLYQLADLMVDYFTLRRMAWAGEKEAIRHWQLSDPEYLDLFMRCYWERDGEERVRMYGDLVEATVEPTGFSWRDGNPMLRISPSELMTRDNLRVAQSFWRSLLTSQ